MGCNSSHHADFNSRQYHQYFETIKSKWTSISLQMNGRSSNGGGPHKGRLLNKGRLWKDDVNLQNGRKSE